MPTNGDPAKPTEIVACIDGSAFAPGVVEYASWAARQLEAPLTFLHVIDHAHAQPRSDLSGSIGLGEQERLLAELAELDAQQGKLAMAHGRVMLDAARERATSLGVPTLQTRQVHGHLVERLTEMSPHIRLVVLGKRGATAHQASDHLGKNLERVIRAMHRPILVVPPAYRRPERILLAFDGSETTRKGVAMICQSPLFRGAAIHVVQVAESTAGMSQALEEGVQALRNAGIDACSAVVAGPVESALWEYQARHEMDLLVMGAYGHSRVRHLLVGSTTTAMIRSATIPLLLLR